MREALEIFGIVALALMITSVQILSTEVGEGRVYKHLYAVEHLELRIKEYNK